MWMTKTAVFLMWYFTGTMFGAIVALILGFV